jgi:uncharacterized membrane protein
MRERQMNNNNQLTAIDLVSLISLVLAYQNLIENREQSAHNDVSAANDKQAAYLLKEIYDKFDEQNEILREILKRVEKSEDVAENNR